MGFYSTGWINYILYIYLGAILMKINIIAVGNIKEKFLIDACQEYIKRIGRFHQITVNEITEEKLPKNYSLADISKCLVKEGLKLDKLLQGYVVVMDLKGEQLDSVSFSKTIEKVSHNFDTITFVIGGSFGIAEEIKNKANYKLCFSKMTFPHQLFRVMLLEQIYRACTISNNIIYHK